MEQTNRKPDWAMTRIMIVLLHHPYLTLQRFCQNAFGHLGYAHLHLNVLHLHLGSDLNDFVSKLTLC